MKKGMLLYLKKVFDSELPTLSMSQLSNLSENPLNLSRALTAKVKIVQNIFSFHHILIL